MTKPKKKQRPSKADLAARIAGQLAAIADSNAEIAQDAINTIGLQMESALDAMTAGTGTATHAAVLAGELSKGLILCEADFAGSREYLPLVLKARDALADAGYRCQRVGKWGLAGPELCALRDFVELRLAQLGHEECTKGIERQAHDIAMQQVASGNAIKFFVTDVEGCAA